MVAEFLQHAAADFLIDGISQRATAQRHAGGEADISEA
jgi:hypothetical protein